jgi:hypothetical protein
MSLTKRSIFREKAIQYYAQSREKDVLPRFVSPPVFWFLWIVLSLCLVMGWLAWNIRTPIYVSAIGIIAESSPSEGTQAVLFVPTNQQRVVHAGEPVQLQIGSSGPLLLRTVTAVPAALLSPEQVRQHYHLDGAASLLVTQPSVIMVVTLDVHVPASSYAGSIVRAQVQIGEQSVLSLLPIIGQLIGA